MRIKTLLAGTCAGLLAAGLLSASPSSAAGKGGIVEVPIEFTVNNTNNTMVECASDGEKYTVRGKVIAPRKALAEAKAATLYLHAVTFGEYYWNLPIKGYNYARELAQLGHVSVAVDRLGYGASGRPAGFDTCFGSEADVANQMIEALKSGDYKLKGAKPASFDKVFVGGASVGGMISGITAATFGNADGVLNFAWGDFAASPYAGQEAVKVNKSCSVPGPGKRGDYEIFARGTIDKFYFNSAPQKVRKNLPGPKLDPCGQLTSLPQAIGVSVAMASMIDVPVFVIFGDADAIFPPPAADQQAARYTGSPEVTKVIVPEASHYPLLEKNQQMVVDEVNTWLNRHS